MKNYFQTFLISIFSTILLLGLLLLFVNNIFTLFTISEIILFSIIVFVVNIFFIWMYFKILYRHGVSKNLISKQDQELIALKTTEKYRREFFGNVLAKKF